MNIHGIKHIKLPALALLFTLTALCSVSAKDFTVVLDAGHGGHDHGATGKITTEKAINLGVALKLGKKLSKTPGIKVVYTRNTDKFVTLQGRADIANKSNGDLFVSLHTNSVDKSSKKRLTVAGSSVYTLGFRRSQENLAVAMRENSVMKLESDYSTVYEGFDPTSDESYIIFEMSQNKHMEQSVNAAKEVQHELITTARRKDHGVRQANFWVLFKTGMPAMLVELDFICNPTVEKFLDSSSGQEKLATAIYNGIMSYKQSVDKDNAILAGEKVTASEKKEPENQTATDAAPGESVISREQEKDTPEIEKPRIVYKIQFLTSSKELPLNSKKFKGLDTVDSYSDCGIHKYTYGEYDSQKGASVDLMHIRKLFPDAFIIKTINGKRVN